MIDLLLPLRLKRLRRTPAIRALVRETHLHPSQLIAPLFIRENISTKQAIASMPGQFQLTLDCLPQEIETLTQRGIQAVLLFGVPAQKDEQGSASWNPEGIVQKAITEIRRINPNLLIIADICFCDYTSHGHCGVLTSEKTVDNDATLVLLSRQAVSMADAGADWVAPSGMTDGMVAAIRQGLDKAGHHDIAILSYSVKYASCMYSPFREATLISPCFSDRKAYQMDPANRNEALREARLDLEEGADVLMVKPAGNYLDVIYQLKTAFPEVPLTAYQVSGEYSMLKAAASQGILNEEQAVMESLLAIKRAGADFIITYFAKDIAPLLA